jgi:hypothetical protein
MTAGAMPGAQVALVAALSGAFLAAVAYLSWRGHLAPLRTHWAPALMILAFSVPDGLVTLRGTWAVPAREADPFVRAFLVWGGWKGLCAALVIWILGWTAALDGMEEVRLRVGGSLARIASLAQIYTLYALALGHLDGLTSWTHDPAFVSDVSSGLLNGLRQYAPWTMTVFPLAYVLYPCLFFGAVFTLAHVGIAGSAREGRGLAGASRPRACGLQGTRAR